MDPKRFATIKKEYDSFYKSLLQKGQLPLRSTEKGFWGHVPADELFEAFSKMELHKYKNFVDLGSGDGKVVLIAALFCERAVGIEIDQELHQKALEMQKKTGISNAIFYNDDFYNHNLAPYQTVFLYPDTSPRYGLNEKLQRELQGYLIHCGHHSHPEGLKKHGSLNIKGTQLTVYKPH